MAEPRPLIAVVGEIAKHGTSIDLTVPDVYLAAIERAGGFPLALFPVDLRAGDARQRLEPFQGLLLIGGGDLDPALYGEAPGDHVYGVNETRDAFEVEILKGATELGLPVLAICRGLQLVNVARGGTLHQHITGRADLEPHGVPRGGQPVLHEIGIDPASELFQVMGVERTLGSCHHHQAVDALGQGLHPSARADDGVVEGLEDPVAGLVAVQWHPEDTAATDPAQQRLFDGLVERSRERLQALVAGSALPA